MTNAERHAQQAATIERLIANGTIKPAGWVCDILGRTDALRCLGNAVVPLQAVAALTQLHPY